MKKDETKMPRTIMVRDKVRLNPNRASVYTRMYGPEVAEKVWTVTHIDKVGKKRLYVDDTPSAIFVSDALLAYSPQSKTRREQLQWK